jgi:SAM domain (Sterile alpha motif)
MDVGDWLRSLGLGQHEALFRENEIDAEVLPELTDGDLEKIGGPLGHRKRLLKAIANLRAAEARVKPTIAPPTASSRDVAERHILARRWERARRGELALIIGEHGLGKSRLIEEFRARLAKTPHTWVRVGRTRRCIRSRNGGAPASAAPKSPTKGNTPNSRRRSARSGSTPPNKRLCSRR